MYTVSILILHERKAVQLTTFAVNVYLNSFINVVVDEVLVHGVQMSDVLEAVVPGVHVA